MDYSRLVLSLDDRVHLLMTVNCSDDAMMYVFKIVDSVWINCLELLD